MFYEFARRGEILKKEIRNIADITLEHAIRFWLYPYYLKGFNHWCVEIANFLPASPKFGDKNTLFRMEVLKSELWSSKKDDLEYYVDDVILKEEPLEPKSGYLDGIGSLETKLDKFYDIYTEKLVDLGKKNKFIKPSEIKKILQESGLI